MRTILTLLILLLTAASVCGEPYACTPTAEDEMGPFYRPGAPMRSSVGSGYETFGTVRSAADCKPIGKARIEFWMTNDHGRYDSERRATWFSAADGSYRFSSNIPSLYTGRPPHIHMRITATGYHTLVTQHYPRSGETEGMFDLVLKPE